MEHYATAQQVYAAGLIFARLGAILLLLPGIGETYVPARVRLSLALVTTLALFPILGAAAPPVPGDVGTMAGTMIKEIFVGLMIGGIIRIFMVSLAATGELVSIATTLSFAQTASPTAEASTTLGAFLSLVGILLVMTTNLHHLFIGAVVKSYTLFPFTRPVPVADATQLAIKTMSGAFALGVQMATPVLAFSLIFNFAIGLVARVMPQFQVFFVASPLMVLLGLSILALSLGVLGMVWVDHYRDLLAPFGA